MNAAVTAMRHAIGNALAKPSPYVSALLESIAGAYEADHFRRVVKPGVVACYEGQRIRDNAKKYRGYIKALTEASQYAINPTVSRMLAESATQPAKACMHELASLINGKAYAEASEGRNPKGKIELRSSELSRPMLESISNFAKKATLESATPDKAMDAEIAAVASAMSKVKSVLEAEGDAQLAQSYDDKTKQIEDNAAKQKDLLAAVASTAQTASAQTDEAKQKAIEALQEKEKLALASAAAINQDTGSVASPAGTTTSAT